MRWDIAVTTVGRMSEPMCGLASHRISTGRARLDEGFEDKAMGGIFGSRIELAVREGPRAAQAKLDIALGVENALL